MSWGEWKKIYKRPKTKNSTTYRRALVFSRKFFISFSYLRKLQRWKLGHHSKWKSDYPHSKRRRSSWCCRKRECLRCHASSWSWKRTNRALGVMVWPWWFMLCVGMLRFLWIRVTPVGMCVTARCLASDGLKKKTTGRHGWGLLRLYYTISGQKDGAKKLTHLCFKDSKLAGVSISLTRSVATPSRSLTNFSHFPNTSQSTVLFLTPLKTFTNKKSPTSFDHTSSGSPFASFSPYPSLLSRPSFSLRPLCQGFLCKCRDRFSSLNECEEGKGKRRVEVCKEEN